MTHSANVSHSLTCIISNCIRSYCLYPCIRCADTHLQQGNQCIFFRSFLLSINKRLLLLPDIPEFLRQSDLPYSCSFPTKACNSSYTTYDNVNENLLQVYHSLFLTRRLFPPSYRAYISPQSGHTSFPDSSRFPDNSNQNHVLYDNSG